MPIASANAINEPPTNTELKALKVFMLMS